MNFLKIAGNDIRNIFKNRIIRVSVIAIIIVPLLYSLLYLDAFWDPYSRIENMPIAVVNLDKGAKLDNEDVNYGDKLVDNLKSNHEVGWRFVSESEANEGLNGKKYYAKFQIPANFSESVIAAKSGSPKVANLQFVSNDKKNFIASQVTGKVQVLLKAQIVKTISNNYVTGAFDNLYKVKDGFAKAADGSNKIYDGLSQLNDKIPTLSDGVTKLSDGSSKLFDGQNQLNDGLKTANDGIGTLNAGAGTLNNGIGTLKNGLGTVNEKVPTLATGVDKLYSGSGQLSTGLGTAITGSTQLTDGSNKLYKAFSTQVYPVIGQLQAGANQLNSELTAGADGITTLNKGASQLISNVDPLKVGGTKIAQSSTAVKAGYGQVQVGVNQLISGVGNTSSALAAIGADLQAGKQQEALAKLQKLLQDSQASAAANAKAIQTLQVGTKQLGDSLGQFDAGVQQYTTSVGQFADGTNALANGTTQLTGKVAKIGSGVNQISSGLNQLEPKLNEKNQGSFGNGLKSVSQGLPTLNSGLNQLNSGATQLNGGLKQLQSNVPALSQGVKALYDGSVQLYYGSNKLAAGTEKLADGSSQLLTGSTKLVDGQTQLKDGIGQLSTKVPTLKDGVTKLYDGSKELSTKLSDGSSELKDGLVNSSETMANFISDPIELSSNPVNAVANYGTGFAPYFILLSLWIGAIMMFFVISTNVETDEKTSKFNKVIGKFLSYAFVGVLQALLVSIVVLSLGLHPTNTPLYILIIVFLSLVFISIIQCLISLFGDAGRVFGIILLILQLTSCAGTFPLEVVPNLFKVLNPFMPFTYGMEALREVISATTINYSLVGKDIAILAFVFIVFLTISIIFKNAGERLQEIIEGRKSQKFN